MLNSLWRLPTHRVEDALVAALPPPKTQLVVLPREKPAPKPRQPTKVGSIEHRFGIPRTVAPSTYENLDFRFSRASF